MLYNITAFTLLMKTKEKDQLLDEFYTSSDQLLKSLQNSLNKVGRYSSSGALLFGETSNAVYTLMQLRSKYNKIKKIK